MASPEPSIEHELPEKEKPGFRGWSYRVADWLFGAGSLREQPRDPQATVARFRNVCISREAGAGAGSIARLVGTRLGWKVYDHEVIEAIAQRMEMPTDEVREPYDP